MQDLRDCAIQGKVLPFRRKNTWNDRFELLSLTFCIILNFWNWLLWWISEQCRLISDINQIWHGKWLFSPHCIRMRDKPGSTAGYNYSLSQNEVLVVLKGHQRVAAIKYSTKGCISTSQSCMPSNSCIYAASIFTSLIKEHVNKKIFWGNWTNKHILPSLLPVYFNIILSKLTSLKVKTKELMRHAIAQ